MISEKTIFTFFFLIKIRNCCQNTLYFIKTCNICHNFHYINIHEILFKFQLIMVEKCGFIGSVCVFYPLCSIYSSISHFRWMAGLSDTTFEIENLRMIWSNHCSNWPSYFWGENFVFMDAMWQQKHTWFFGSCDFTMT
jgi:hypothetical protein